MASIQQNYANNRASSSVYILDSKTEGSTNSVLQNYYYSNASLLRRIRALEVITIRNSQSYQYGQLVFPKTISAWNGLSFAEALPLAVFRPNVL